jgi:hypothetical protein
MGHPPAPQRARIGEDLRQSWEEFHMLTCASREINSLVREPPAPLRDARDEAILKAQLHDNSEKFASHPPCWALCVCTCWVALKPFEAEVALQCW